jgi:hypothetical protein
LQAACHDVPVLVFGNAVQCFAFIVRNQFAVAEAFRQLVVRRHVVAQLCHDLAAFGSIGNVVRQQPQRIRPFAVAARRFALQQAHGRFGGTVVALHGQ